MMICKNCGGQNPDGARFCNLCGASLSAPAAVMNQSQRQQSRNAETAELERMIRYFSQKAGVYAEYDNVCAELDRCAGGKHYALLIWGIIISALGMVFFAALQSKNSTLIVAAALIPFLLGQGMIVGHIVYAISFDQKRGRLIRRYHELSDELYSFYRAYGSCLIGPEYTNPTNLNTILRTIRSGRADSTKEAINVLLDDVYRNNMQRLAAQTARSAAVAARGATVTAVFSTANFFIGN